MQFEKITIIGLGLIGGSLAMALKKSAQVQRVVGVDSSTGTIRTALEKGIIDEGHAGSTNEATDSDVVVIATHVGSIVKVAESLNVAGHTVVTDTGSVKQSIVNGIYESCDINFVGSHPIAGTEKSGVENVVDGLFQDKIAIITPTEKTDHESKEKIARMWRLAGSKVTELGPKKHDEIFAHVSHLPHVVAFGLLNAVFQKDSSFFDYAGGSFNDLTRITRSSTDMWADIFSSNKKEVLNAIEGFKGCLEEIEKCIERGDKESLKGILDRVSNIK